MHIRHQLCRNLIVPHEPRAAVMVGDRRGLVDEHRVFPCSCLLRRELQPRVDPLDPTVELGVAVTQAREVLRQLQPSAFRGDSVRAQILGVDVVRTREERREHHVRAREPVPQREQQRAHPGRHHLRAAPEAEVVAAGVHHYDGGAGAHVGLPSSAARVVPHAALLHSAPPPQHVLRRVACRGGKEHLRAAVGVVEEHRHLAAHRQLAVIASPSDARTFPCFEVLVSHQ
mmetsp:Transcript_39361/g.85631  ORF Transcript_39361/g.85631 Transcript_39361/m.85631 type:complete len:229 (+) Transcript_39361:1532-2218(+)